jgi:hypothetical protein
MALSMRTPVLPVNINSGSAVATGQVASVGDFGIATLFSRGGISVAHEITSVSQFIDSVGNTWTQLIVPTSNPNGTSSCSIVVYTSLITNAILVGTTFTATFSNPLGTYGINLDVITGFLGTATLDPGTPTTVATSGSGVTAKAIEVPVLATGTGVQSVKMCYAVVITGNTSGVQGTTLASGLTGTETNLGYISSNTFMAASFLTTAAPTSASYIEPQWTTARVALGVGLTVYDNQGGTGSLSAAYSGLAIGTVVVPATASFSASYTGATNAAMAATAPDPGIAYSGLAQGTVAVSASAALSVGYTGLATGTVKLPGTAPNPGIAYSGLAQGTVAVSASAALSVGYTGLATGTVKLPGTAPNPGIAYSGLATGTVRFGGGKTELDVAYSGAATATVTVPSTSELDVAFSGSALASVELGPVVEFDAAYEGEALATIEVEGASELDVGYEGEATATIELDVSAELDVAYEGVAIGTVEVDTSSELDIAYTGLAIGTVQSGANPAGYGALDVAYDGEAIATIEISEVASELDIAYTGLASATVEVEPTAGFTAGFEGLAIGQVVVEGFAALEVGYVGAGYAPIGVSLCEVEFGFYGLARGAWVVPPAVPFVEQPLIFGVPAILEVAEPASGQDNQPANTPQPVATQTFTPGNGPWPPA